MIVALAEPFRGPLPELAFLCSLQRIRGRLSQKLEGRGPKCFGVKRIMNQVLEMSVTPHGTIGSPAAGRGAGCSAPRDAWEHGGA